MRDDKFDLEQFKAGRDAITRDGSIVKFIAHVPEANAEERLVCFERCVGVFTTSEEGVYWTDEANFDLVKMAPKETKAVTIYAAYDGTDFLGASESEGYMAEEYKGRKIIPMTGEL